MKHLLALAIGVVALAPFAAAQQSRTFFPQDSVRGYLNFEFAPPHNEPDFGLCATPGPANSRCAAFARYVWGGYVEVQPFGGAYLRRLFFFADPKLYGGNNLPGLNYTASGSPIGWERTFGAGVELPKSFELRVTHHDTQLFGKYSGSNSVVNLSRNGPLGLYTTVGVRWYFGKYGRADLHE
ncbi:MAG: hypothetical protein ABSH47_02825 [Bryobacteraceae bacterium]|jgi:hypothetical protein